MLTALKVTAGLLAIGYLGVLGLLFAFQNRLLYPSAGVVQPLPPEVSLGEVGLVAWPADAPRALVSTVDSARATVVVFHGNGGTALQRGYYVEALRARGLRVVLAEYPGYGWRTGDVSEVSFVADARGTLEAVHGAFGGPIVAWGESLGAGVAAAAVGDLGVPVEAVVLMTPWDALPNVAAAAYPWAPVRLLLRDSYDSVANLAGFESRVAVLVAEGDEVIPAAHGQALHAALGAGARLWTFPGAGHNTWPSHPDAAWWDSVLGYALDEPGRPR